MCWQRGLQDTKMAIAEHVNSIFERLSNLGRPNAEEESCTLKDIQEIFSKYPGVSVLPKIRTKTPPVKPEIPYIINCTNGETPGSSVMGEKIIPESSTIVSGLY